MPTVNEYWDKKSSTYESEYNFATPLVAKKIKRKAQLIELHGQIISTDFVLELGCGTGAVTKQIVKSGCNLIATDISIEMLKIARENNPNTKFQQADAHNLPFKDGLFDLVYGVYVLMYTDYRKALSEIHRVLKPSGRIVFIEINKLNPIAFSITKFPLKQALKISDEAISFYPWELHRACEEANFSDIEVIPFEFEWSVPLGELNNLLERIPVVKEIAGNHLLIAEKK